ncbi:hypothetical protein GJT88_00450 [Enterobacteriaceae endosymbiont of Donacia tomentosa]|uniref:DNA polymerase III subunit delta' C-terminal domain-containing protein n=1 Tax=Enterobacteriaceae endosymbiont of Donacia tomentosa TaxID=2675787 RepID=UPI001448FD87|nr:DNA polymerase III subunit delta' C-terminal domain-containing protein [Enterobacteriaceae endosymbiont of Donacia tomentosa]QJC31542.1 hypothetical protein GJT88_00450 [Enterobacteriaceae endosymbiont of Donacia tomentosa]
MIKSAIFSWYPWLNFFYKKIIYQFLNKKSYHAFIFCSINGIGTISLVYALVKWIFCTNKKDIYSCNKCSNCLLIETKNHPDLYIIKNNKININISVEVIRNIINTIYKYSYKDIGKVIWLPYAQQLNMFSSNAILKVLEEPSQKTWFFLQCNNINDLLPTITSRCQIWYIYPPNEDIGIFWIKQQSNNIINKKIIQTALRIFNNSPIYAYKILNNPIWENRKILYKILLSSLKNDIMDLMLILNNKDILLYLNWVYLILLDITKFHLKINKKYFYNIDQLYFINKISDLIILDNIILIIKKILYYRSLLIDINLINRELVLIKFLLSIEKILKCK